MKSIALVLCCFLLPLSLYAQPMTGTFEQAMDDGISFTELDSVYKSAIHSDVEQGVFKEKKSEFIGQYRSMMAELGRFLHEHNFSWEGKKRFFQRIYFDNDGTIDYYFVHLARTDFSEEKKTRLKELIADFSSHYQLPISGSQKFAQCSPISFADPQQPSETNKE